MQSRSPVITSLAIRFTHSESRLRITFSAISLRVSHARITLRAPSLRSHRATPRARFQQITLAFFGNLIHVCAAISGQTAPSLAARVSCASHLPHALHAGCKLRTLVDIHPPLAEPSAFIKRRLINENFAGNNSFDLPTSAVTPLHQHVPQLKNCCTCGFGTIFYIHVPFG